MIAKKIEFVVRLTKDFQAKTHTIKAGQTMAIFSDGSSRVDREGNYKFDRWYLDGSTLEIPSEYFK
jgi:hypothetical protein